jgi:hypothetical protein
MHIFEEVDEIEKYNQFVESLFALLQPEAYQKHKAKTDLQRLEEGVDQVIYHGEDDWNEIMKDFHEFGITNVDVFGEGLKSLKDVIK